jgi:hypothetical protein
MLLYRPATDYARLAEEFAHDYQAQTGRDLEVVNLDTIEGARLAELYGIISYPAILVVDQAGVMQNFWQGMPLPLISEVSAAHRVN